MLTTRDLCERWGRSPSYVSRLVKSGALRPTIKLAGLRGSYLFSPTEVERYENDTIDEAAS